MGAVDTVGFRFRKSFKLLPGVRLNVSKSGIGVSAGVKGARIGVGPRGVRVNAGIPGSGIGYEHRLGGGHRAGSGPSPAFSTPYEPPSVAPMGMPAHRKPSLLPRILLIVALCIAAWLVVLFVIGVTVGKRQ